MILELTVNKENTVLVSDNETSCYVIGIGETDYTIHKEADSIESTYNDDNYFRNFTILDKHSYHVFRHSIRTIVDDIKWKKEIAYECKKYKVEDAYIGIKDKSRAKLDDGYSRYPSLIFEGADINTIPEKIKYVLKVSEIK
ncbi:MAG: hypothetical protein GY749_30940 [Desulfobacteraceae bacterium]|nr:hypothetical protein [Desulfobacteraceae bacterium]